MSEGAEHQPLIIYIDRGKFLKTNVAIFLLGGGLTFLAFAPWHHAKSNTNILVWFARALLLVWGWFYAPILPWLLFPKPVVMVNDEGISYRPPRIGPFAFGGSLSWKQIKALYIGEVTTHQIGRIFTRRILCVLPRDAEAFLQPYTILNKTVLTFLLMRVGSPFGIPEPIISHPVDELLASIRLHYADIISAYEIEFREG